MGGKAKNIEKPSVFFGFIALFRGLEEVSEHLGGCLGRCWLHDFIFRNVFGHVGDKMANKRGKMATKRANMATKSAKMSQHERERGSRLLRVFCRCGYVDAGRGCGGP